MAMQDKVDVFTSLPRTRYLSQEWYGREVEQVFYKQWLLFGHVSDVARPGDTMTRDLSLESVTVTRDSEGELHGFFNVCRHRGYRICDSGPAEMKQIVCPYHRWSYALDGHLLGAPAMRDGAEMNYSEFALRPVHLEEWHGWLFVCVGETPPPRSVSEGFAGAADRVGRYAPEQLRKIHTKEYDVSCNWKLLLENFLECYHCAGSHPELISVFDHYSGEGSFVPGEEFLWVGTPFPQGVKSQTLSGAPASRVPLGEIDLENPPTPTGVAMVPTLSSIQFIGDYAVTHQFLPAGTHKTKMVSEWFVHEDAVAGVDFEVNDVIAVWSATNAQDAALSERNQLGVNSRSYTPGPNSALREPGIRGALATYHRMMDEPELYAAALGN